MSKEQENQHQESINSIREIMMELLGEEKALIGIKDALDACQAIGNEIGEVHLKAAYEEILKAIESSLTLGRCGLR